MLKKFFLLTVVLSMSVFGFSGCGAPKNQENGKLFQEPSKAPSEKDKAAKNVRKIALVMKTLTNPFFIEMEKGARKAQQEFGLELIVKTGAQETSIEQQIAIVEELISSKVNAIVIAPGSSTELIPVLKKAQDTGIKIVNIDNRLDKELSRNKGLLNVPFISVDNEKSAYLSAKYISDKIKKPTKAVLIEGIREADNAQNRKLGALRAFKENKNITLVASETANWKIDEANRVIEEIYKKHPDLGAVFCANDMMALGVINYFDKINKSNILIAGYDALEDALIAISKGKLQVTIDQKPSLQGYLGIKQALGLLKGEQVPPETMIDVEVIDKSKISK